MNHRVFLGAEFESDKPKITQKTILFEFDIREYNMCNLSIRQPCNLCIFYGSDPHECTLQISSNTMQHFLLPQHKSSII